MSLSALGDAGINRAGPFILARGFKAELLPSCEKRPQAAAVGAHGTGTGAHCSLESRSEGCPRSGLVSSRWAGAHGVVPQLTWKWETSERSETAPCPCLPARSCPPCPCLPPLLSPAPPGPVQNPVLPPGLRLCCPQPRTAGGASANTRDLTATRCRLDSRTLEPRVLWTLVVIIYCGVKDALEPET